MSITEKIKDTKGKAILAAVGPAMHMIDEWTKDIEPENEVSKFTEMNLALLFEQPNENMNSIVGMLSKMAVVEANIDPEFVLYKMLRFYEALRVWYPEYQQTTNANKKQ